MENSFLVSARKYRPASFSEMLGQDGVSTTLRNSILQQKIAHAYLFCGPRGVGKTSVARIFAKTINCQNITPEGEACNECESCRAIDEHRSFNLLEMDAASNNSAEDIRRINDEVNIRPQYGKYKVYIIDEVHMLSSSAFNTFLKTLEEPPHHVVFILATTEKNKILPTIISRCQVFEFKPIPSGVISEQLHKVADTEGFTYESRALDLIARLADGGMRDALSIFDRVVSATNGNVTYERTIKSLNILDDEYYFSITNRLLKGDYSKALTLLDEILAQGVNPRTVITGLAQFMRNLLVSLSPETRNLFEYTGADANRFAELAETCPPIFLYRAIDKLVTCDRNYRSSNAKRLLIELTLISIADLSGGLAASIPQRTDPPSVQKKNDVAEQSTPSSAQPSSVERRVEVKAPTTSPIKVKVEEKETEVSVRSLSNSGSKTIPSLKRMNAPKNAHLLDSSQNSTPSERTPIEEDRLIDLWGKFSQEELSQEIYLRQAMQTHCPKVVSGDLFRVTLLNELQKKEVEDSSDRILTYLRKHLHNHFLQMELEVDKANAPAIPVTTQEKLQRLIDLNNKVSVFIDRLGLRLK